MVNDPQQLSTFIHIRTSILLGLALFLFICHFLGSLLEHGAGHDYIFGLRPLFDMGREFNIPNFYSSLLALLSAVYIMNIITIKHKTKTRMDKFWYFLVVVFIAYTTDDWFAIHERLIEPLQIMFSFKGPLYYAWIVPYGIIFFILLCLGRNWFVQFSNDEKKQLLSAIALLIAASFGMELFEGNYVFTRGEAGDWIHDLLIGVEETTEMVSLILLHNFFRRYYFTVIRSNF